MFGRKKQPERNLLELVPRRLRDSETGDDGIVTVSVPRFKYEWMMRGLVPRGKNPNIRTRLDAFGSFVWSQIDGERTVADIAHALEERYGEDVHPVYDRLGVFIRAMRDRTFIVLLGDDGEPI